MYHGTSAENYKSIIHEGVREHNYWTPYLSAAIQMGGCIVISTYFEGIDEEWVGEGNWEYVSPEAVLPSRFISICKYDVQLLLYNGDENRNMRKFHAKKDGRPWCEYCDGHGELTYLNNGHWFLPGMGKFDSPNTRAGDKIIVCPKCRGYG